MSVEEGVGRQGPKNGRHVKLQSALIRPIVWRVPIRSSSESQLIEMPQPARQPVPTRAVLIHQIGPE